MKNKIFKNNNLPNGFNLLNKYTIIKKISSGGFGVVYLVRNNNKTYAMKEFLPLYIPCRINQKQYHIDIKNHNIKNKFEIGLNNFFSEADTLREINHKNIISVVDVFKANGTAYFVMPLEIGLTLNDLLKEENLSEKEIIDIFIQVCDGLDFLHNKGLLHLDIKPNNLWVRPDKTVVILDLGAARYKDNYYLLAPPAKTPGYAAPEQHNVLKKTNNVFNLTNQTDIYALAASIYYCIEKKSPPKSINRKINDVPLSILRIGQYSKDFLNLIDNGMNLSISERVKTIKDFRARLLNISTPLQKNNQFFILNE